MQRTTWVTTWILLFSIAGCDYPSARFKSSFYPIQSAIPELKQPVSSLKSNSELPASTVNAGGDLWSRLQRADTHYIVLMRHALAPGTGDPANFQLADCSTQRNLSDEGRSQARRTGETFRQRGVAVNRVLSSQWCRCLETAELMDIGNVEPFSALNSFFRDRTTGPDQTAQVREFMLESQDTPGVTVMITHAVNVSALTGAGASSGEMVVITVNDQNQLEVVGQIEAL
ncbi:MAG: histidine phosphatase family protein [Cyanobacteria bacterium J06635_15]